MLDRSRLARWLEGPHRTWRWHDGSEEAYRGVETTDAGLRWFGWSHAFDAGRDGLHDERLQPWASYLADGPAAPMPDDARRELEAWAAAHLPPAGQP